VEYTLALGPFQPAWIGPQRFLIRVRDERVADVEYQHEFNERGCAERLPRLDLAQALHLVTRLCGTCSFAHSLAFCQALEQLAGLNVSFRARLLRSAAAETERLTAHLRAAALLLQVLGAEESAAQLERLCEASQQIAALLHGARLMPDLCLPGGLRRDLSTADREQAVAGLHQFSNELYRAVDRMISQPALLSRTVDVGVLNRSAAEQFGVRGPMARASGIGRDTRADYAYAAYAELGSRPVTQEGGDVYSRLALLLLEAIESAKLIEQALRDLPEEPVQGEIPERLPRGKGQSVVEGPHGMIRYDLQSDGKRLTEVRIDTPRQLDRLLVRTLLSGALVDDVAAIITSTAPCTACAEL
jgi:Ni,Fe-hydrogenase III large subunit